MKKPTLNDITGFVIFATLIVTLLFWPATARADTSIATFGLNEKHDIVLTLVECPDGDGTIAFIKTQGGRVVAAGCWSVLGDNLRVDYQEHGNYLYRIDQLVPR